MAYKLPGQPNDPKNPASYTPYPQAASKPKSGGGVDWSGGDKLVAGPAAHDYSGVDKQFSEQQKNAADLLKAAEDKAKASAGMVGTYEQQIGATGDARDAELAELRRTAARNLAASQGRFAGSGAGLDAARGSAHAASAQSAQVAAGFNQQAAQLALQQAAQREIAAQAAADLASTKQEMLNAQNIEPVINQKLDLAKSIAATKDKETYYLSGAEKKALAEQIRQRLVYNEPNKAVRDAIENWIQTSLLSYMGTDFGDIDYG